MGKSRLERLRTHRGVSWQSEGGYVVDKKNRVGSSWYADPLPSLGYRLNVLLIQ